MRGKKRDEWKVGGGGRSGAKKTKRRRESKMMRIVCVRACVCPHVLLQNYLLNENAHLWNVYINKTNTHQFALESLMP